MKALLILLTLIPMTAMADLDDSVFDGASTSKQSDHHFMNYSSVFNGTSETVKQTRNPASHDKKEFTFKTDGYDTGASVDR